MAGKSVPQTTIVSAHARIWRAGLSLPFRTALGQHDLLENVLLAVRLAGGVQGYGEAAVATHITGETVAGTLKNLTKCADEIVGRDVMDYLPLTRAYAERFHMNHCASAALEMALLDAYTRYHQIPLWRFFGRQPRRLKTDMTVVLGSVDEAVSQAKRIRSLGMHAVKIKIGQIFDQDLERVCRIHEICADKRIYLDANQGYRARDTLKFLRCLETKNIRPVLVEQPVAKGDWEGLREVSRGTRILVCADESVSSLADLGKLIRGRYAGAVNIKFMKSGIFQACEIVRRAKAAGLKLMIGQMMETPLAASSAAHFAAAMGGFDFVDLDSPFFIRPKTTRGRFLSRGGIYDVRRVKAGIGVTPVAL